MFIPKHNIFEFQLFTSPSLPNKISNEIHKYEQTGGACRHKILNGIESRRINDKSEACCCSNRKRRAQKLRRYLRYGGKSPRKSEGSRNYGYHQCRSEENAAKKHHTFLTQSGYTENIHIFRNRDLIIRKIVLGSIIGINAPEGEGEDEEKGDKDKGENI